MHEQNTDLIKLFWIFTRFYCAKLPSASLLHKARRVRKWSHKKLLRLFWKGIVRLKVTFKRPGPVNIYCVNFLTTDARLARSIFAVRQTNSGKFLLIRETSKFRMPTNRCKQTVPKSQRLLKSSVLHWNVIIL